MTDIIAMVDELIEAGTPPGLAASIVCRAFAAGGRAAPWRSDSEDAREKKRAYDRERMQELRRRTTSYDSRTTSYDVVAPASAPGRMPASSPWRPQNRIATERPGCRRRMPGRRLMRLAPAGCPPRLARQPWR